MPADADESAAASLAESTVVVVVTNQGEGERLTTCLDALHRAGGATGIVVVDNSNSSAAGNSAAFPVTVLRTANEGYGAAFNAAAQSVQVAAADYVALLNDDIVVEPGWIDPLVAALRDAPEVGAVQPVLVLADTDPPLINSVGVEFDRFGAASDIGFRRPVASIDREVRPIDMFTGGAVVFRRAFLDDVGGFDERYFLYYEDVDLSLRGAERGWTYRCVPDSVVSHTRGASTDHLADRRRALQERNRLIVAARFGTPGTFVRGLGLSVRRLRHAPRRAHCVALASGLARAPRAWFERCRARRHATMGDVPGRSA